jgi:hypothetical protein
MININSVFLMTGIVLASRHLFKMSIEGRSIIAVNAAYRTSNDELGLLVASFNQMTRDL